MESLKHKEGPDENAIYRFEVEGVSILHLGDLGNPLTNEQLAMSNSTGCAARWTPFWR